MPTLENVYEIWKIGIKTTISFIGGGNRTDLPQVIDKLYHIMMYRVQLVLAGLELTTLVVIGTDCYI
jgi:hypothetical protein